MISCRNCEHIFEFLNSLPVFTLLVLCGDQMQFQPFETTTSGSTVLLSSFDNRPSLSSATHFLLTIQHGCADERLNLFLKHIRHFHITNHQLHKSLQSISWLNFDEEVTSDTIIKAYNTHPNTTFLTHSRTSSHYINCELIDYIFANTAPLLNAVLASDLQRPQPIFPNMKLMITENRDKDKGVINTNTWHSSFVNQQHLVHRVQQKPPSSVPGHQRRQHHLLSCYSSIFNHHCESSR